MTSVAVLLQTLASRGSRRSLGIHSESLGLRPASRWAVVAVAATDGEDGDPEGVGGGAEPASEEQPTPGPTAASVSKGAPRRKPAGNPKISAKNFVLSDRARAKKVADVTKYIAQAKAEAGAEPLEKAGRVRLVLVGSMVVLSESARNIVNLTTQPDMKWTFKEALDFLLSEEAESLRDLMVLEGSYALDLLARQAGRKAVQRFRQAVSPLTSRLPGLEQLGAVRLPFLLPTAAGGTTVVLEPPELVLERMVPVLNKDEEAHVQAIEGLVREIFGEQAAALVSGERLTVDDLQRAVGAISAGAGQDWYTAIREGWVREVESLQEVAALAPAPRAVLLGAVRAVLDKVWARVLRRAATFSPAPPPTAPPAVAGAAAR
eukprot:EG_transcript_10263